MPNDRHQRPGPQLFVIRYWNGDRVVGISLLHYHMAATSSHFDETMQRENPADLSTPKERAV